MAMRMKNPAHPGKLIQANIEALDLTISQAAEYLQVEEELLGAITRGEHPVTARVATRMNKMLGKPIDDEVLLLMQMSYDIA
jgi:addiction module HigA family antidote